MIIFQVSALCYGHQFVGLTKYIDSNSNYKKIYNKIKLILNVNSPSKVVAKSVKTNSLVQLKCIYCN